MARAARSFPAFGGQGVVLLRQPYGAPTLPASPVFHSFLFVESILAVRLPRHTLYWWLIPFPLVSFFFHARPLIEFRKEPAAPPPPLIFSSVLRSFYLPFLQPFPVPSYPVPWKITAERFLKLK